MTQLPHVLKRIRLNLARSKEFPSGSDRDGYEFVAPARRQWAHRSRAVAQIPRALRRASVLGGRE